MKSALASSHRAFVSTHSTSSTVMAAATCSTESSTSRASCAWLMPMPMPQELTKRDSAFGPSI